MKELMIRRYLCDLFRGSCSIWRQTTAHSIWTASWTNPPDKVKFHSFAFSVLPVLHSSSWHLL